MTFEVKNEQQTAGIIMRESEEIPPTRDRMARGIGNWELAVIAEDERFSQKLDDTYLQDLARSGKGNFQQASDREYGFHRNTGVVEAEVQFRRLMDQENCRTITPKAIRCARGNSLEFLAYQHSRTVQST